MSLYADELTSVSLNKQRVKARNHTAPVSFTNPKTVSG